MFEEVITKMPDHAESYSTIASIYGKSKKLLTLLEDLRDYEKSLSFGVMAAYLIRTDVERWKKCA